MEYVYGALLLHKLGQEVNEDNLKKVVEATGTKVDTSKVKTLVASLQGVDISSELENASVSIASGGGAAGAETEAAHENKKEKKEDDKPSESAAGLASLFG